VLGAQLSPYLTRGEWQLGAGVRNFYADEQYTGKNLNLTVMNLGTQVQSDSTLFDFNATYGLDERITLTLGQPFLAASSTRALPANRRNTFRYDHSTHEFGDLSLVARRWMKDTAKNLDSNYSLGLGVKFPTGNENHMDFFPDATGNNVRLRPVDQSILPGDGGTGIIFDFQGFTPWGKRTLFANASYLANPRTQTQTLSPRSLLSPTGPNAIPLNERFNTVADQYLVRMGFSEPIERVKGLSMTLAGRWEGVPQEDIFGRTFGFRRPGYTIAVEPGLIYQRGAAVYSVSAPLTTMQNRQPNLGLPGDSTFADVVLLASATIRFGGKKQVVACPPGQPSKVVR
jgi:hypothetical protein